MVTIKRLTEALSSTIRIQDRANLRFGAGFEHRGGYGFLGTCFYGRCTWYNAEWRAGRARKPAKLAGKLVESTRQFGLVL